MIPPAYSMNRGHNKPEQEREDRPRNRSHREGDRERLRPSLRQRQVVRIAGPEVDPLGNHHQQRQSNADRREDDVEPQRCRHLGSCHHKIAHWSPLARPRWPSAWPALCLKSMPLIHRCETGNPCDSVRAPSGKPPIACPSAPATHSRTGEPGGLHLSVRRRFPVLPMSFRPTVSLLDSGTDEGWGAKNPPAQRSESRNNWSPFTNHCAERGLSSREQLIPSAALSNCRRDATTAPATPWYGRHRCLPSHAI